MTAQTARATRVHYASILDAIGYYVEKADGADVFVQELGGEAFLVAILQDDGQMVKTFDAHEVESLWDNAQGTPLRTTGARRRHFLRGAGAYLDAHDATAVLIQERLGDYAVQFTGRADLDAAADRGRHTVKLDDLELEALAATNAGPSNDVETPLQSRTGLWSRLRRRPT